MAAWDGDQRRWGTVDVCSSLVDSSYVLPINDVSTLYAHTKKLSYLITGLSYYPQVNADIDGSKIYT